MRYYSSWMTRARRMLISSTTEEEKSYWQGYCDGLMEVRYATIVTPTIPPHDPDLYAAGKARAYKRKAPTSERVPGSRSTSGQRSYYE